MIRGAAVEARLDHLGAGYLDNIALVREAGTPKIDALLFDMSDFPADIAQVGCEATRFGSVSAILTLVPALATAAAFTEYRTSACEMLIESAAVPTCPQWAI